MGRAERSRGHKRFFAIEQTGNAVDLCRLDGFFERHRWNDGRDALGQHRLARAGRPDHQDVVTTGDGHFDRTFDVALALHVAKIDIVVLVAGEKHAEIAAGWKQRNFTAQKLKCLPQILYAVDVDLVHHGGLARVCFRHKHSVLAAPARFQSDWQHALDGTHRAVQRELTDEAEFFESRRVDLLAHRDHPERDGEIEAWAFFLNIGGREIDCCAAARPVIPAICNRGGDAVADLFHRRVR